MEGAMDGAMDGEGDGNNRVNPFMLPPVLQTLFEQLSLEDLRKCRLVNKLWYRESLSTLRSNASLKFGEEGIVSTRDDGSSHITSLGEFLGLWDAGDWGSCPFINFNFLKWDFEAEDVEQKRFLELVGGHVSSLTLERCFGVGRDNFRRIIYQAFPKLQFLKIERCGVDHEYWRKSAEEILEYKEPDFGVHELKSLHFYGCHPHSMMDMLSHFHKLESLRIEEESDLRNLLETIKLIRAQDPTKLPLKNFDIKFELCLGYVERTTPYIELLNLHDQLNLPIQRLDIWISNEEDIDMDYNLNNKNPIRDILQFHSSTLTFLTVHGNGYDEQHPCKPFPFGFQLENLKQLVFPSRLSNSLSFLIYTPTLRSLKIENGWGLSMSESDNLFANSSQLEIGDWTLPSLTDLVFRAPLSVRNLEKLMKWMPNLEELRGLELDDVKFALVCKNWTNLKELVEFGRELTDKGVIGIQNAFGASGTEEMLIGPNITKLKNLTTFCTFSRNLTSASVRDGFLKLANLKRLRLGRSLKIGNKAESALARRDIKLNY